MKLKISIGNLVLFTGMIVVIVASVFLIKSYIKRISIAKDVKKSEIEVTITPKILEVGKKPSFEIFFNTHTIDLDFEVDKITYLKDENGKVYKDSVWDGPPAGGHHRKGTLSFKGNLTKTKKITLFFRGFGQIEGKEYIFNL